MTIPSKHVGDPPADPPPSPEPPPGRAWAWAASLVGATILTYWPALSGGFLWDDDRYVTKPALRSVHGLGRIWFEPGAAEQYYPLLHTGFWVQHRAWGDLPLGYHLVTVLLHATAAILFAGLLKRLAIPGAWLAATIFALHPVHVESVAWIAEQKNTLSLVCFLAAAFVYVRFDTTRRPAAYALALAWFVLALLSKTVTATLPAALLVVFWWKRGRLDGRRDVRPLLPWLALGAVSGLFSSWVERHFLGADGTAFARPIAERGLIAGRAVWSYLGHLVWPTGLNFVYPPWTVDATAILPWALPLGALGLGLWLWTLRGRTRAPLAAYLIFVGTLFPVLGFVNLYGSLYSVVWDHWQYLSDLAPIAWGAAACTMLVERLAPGARSREPVLAAGLGLILGILAFVHCESFHDNETLYRTTLERNPNCWMAENNLAILLKDSGRAAEAVGHFENALRLDPGQPEVIQNNLGIALASLGRLPEAIGHYEEALRLKPAFPDAQSNLGIALAKSGRTEDAIPWFERALSLQPKRTDIRNYLARALTSLGRRSEAIGQYEEALRLGADHPEALHYNLGLALADAGRLTDAIDQFGQAVHLDPDYAEAQNDLGIAQANSGRLTEAIASFRQVVRLRPGSAEAHENLAEALKAVGDLAEAQAESQAANRLGNPASRPEP